MRSGEAPERGLGGDTMTSLRSADSTTGKVAGAPRASATPAGHVDDRRPMAAHGHQGVFHQGHPHAAGEDAGVYDQGHRSDCGCGQGVFHQGRWSRSGPGQGVYHQGHDSATP